MTRKLLLVLGLSLALVACGSKTYYVTSTEAPNSQETTVKVVKTTDAPIATAAPSTWTEEDEFIFDINESYGSNTGVPDDEMIESGYLVCTALRGGASGYEIVEVLSSSANGDPDIELFLSSVIASAVINFCPDQQYKFDN
jgi:hypothetical protein